MANICSVTMYFYGEKSAVEDLHARDFSRELGGFFRLHFCM